MSLEKWFKATSCRFVIFSFFFPFAQVEPTLTSIVMLPKDVEHCTVAVVSEDGATTKPLRASSLPPTNKMFARTRKRTSMRKYLENRSSGPIFPFESEDLEIMAKLQALVALCMLLHVAAFNAVVSSNW